MEPNPYESIKLGRWAMLLLAFVLVAILTYGMAYFRFTPVVCNLCRLTYRLTRPMRQSRHPLSPFVTN